MAWPTTKEPRTEFVTLRLTKAEAADLDRAVSSSPSHQTRSAYVRTALERVLAADARKAARKKQNRQKQNSQKQNNQKQSETGTDG